jgi:large repetitive protein
MVKSNKPSRNLKSLLQKRTLNKQRRRGRVFETLERRELMANDFSPAVEGILSRMRLDGEQSYMQAGSMIAARLGGGTSSGGGGVGAGESGAPLNLTEIEPNDMMTRAQLVPLSSTGSSLINIAGSFRTTLDEDFYAFDLRKGDILDTRITGATGTLPTLALYTADGTELQFARGRFLGGNAFSTLSPLYRDGATTLPYVIDTTGRYFLRAGDGISAYSLNLRVHRSVLEAEPIGTQQIIYVDFDGSLTRSETINLTALGVPAGPLRIPSFSRYMPLLGLTTADTPSVIRNIMSRVERKMQPLLAQNSNNGYFPESGNPGEFSVRLVSSLDSPDMWGQANVSRVLVGGTQAELGIDPATGLLGIAQSVDLGNFTREETTLVMVDIMIDNAMDPTVIPIAGNVSRVDAFAELIADTIAHEAGHTLGGVHQDSSNFVDTIMDQFYVPLISVGAGPDGIFGNRDDVTLKFLDDEYSPTAGIPFGGGVANSPDVLAFGMSTGTVGGSITGIAYNDSNRNARQDGGELGLAGWQVFIDRNNNGVLELGEARTTTDTAGRYTLRAAAGTYNVRLVRPAGWIASTSTEEVKAVTLALSTVATANFGSVAPSSAATGFKWLDLNGDGVRDAGEPGLAGVYIYLDLDGDGRPDVGEPASVSKADGSYLIMPPGAGTYFIREVVDPGYVQTFPASGSHTAVFDGVNPLRGFDFGNRESSDWGDAPAPYPTSRSANGASHGVTPGLRLGSNWDAELDGMPSANADGDDTTGPLGVTGSVIDDEDGVSLLSTIVRGDTQNSIRINVTNTTTSGAFLQGWIDFNGNGVWGDAGEQIFTNKAVVAGNNDLTFTAPSSAVSRTAARFRLSQQKDLAPTGRSNSGEVEDYFFSITNGPRRNLQDDVYTVARNSVSNQFDVLANDFIPPGDAITALLAGASAQGASVSVGTGNTVRYTPARGFFGQDTFNYTVVYASGKRETANVTVNVTLQFTDPVSVDDSFDLPTNSISYPLNVLVNDIEGSGGALIVSSFTPPNKGGSVTIGSGGLSLRYTPRRGFGGTEQFTYTTVDSNGKTSTANVTMHTLEGDRADDDVQFSFSFRSLAGAPITSVTQGDQFQVYVHTYDLRPDEALAETPPRQITDPGVYAAYLDLLYSSNLVLPSSPGTNTTLDFANRPQAPYTDGVSGTAAVPGIISSLGAFTGSQKPPFEFGDPSLVTVLTFTARSAGIAEFVGDPADESPNTDVVLYNPPNAPVPVEQVRYLRSSLEIVPRGVELPIAVDDSTGELPLNTTSFINVMGNDIIGTAGPLRIQSVTQPRNGVVSIDNRGTTNTSDDRIQFVPNTTNIGFSDQFTYTVADTRGFTSTATVTVQVGNSSVDDKIKLTLRPYSLQGNPITSINVGASFELRGFVQDLRSPMNLSGVFAAYQDILYDRAMVSVPASTTNSLGFGIDFSTGANGYNEGKSGDIRIPGLINEVGSFQSSLSPLGTAEFLQFKILMTATTAGVTRFTNDPADISPFHDSLLYSDQRNKVPFDQITFVPSQLVILNSSSGGSGGGEGNTNSNNRFDVNGDGFVSPIDALILVNLVNQGSGGLLGGGSGAGGSGEGEGGETYYVDVNSDNYLSPLDILWVVNELNSRSGANGEGESSAPAIELASGQMASVPVPFLRPARSTATSSAWSTPALSSHVDADSVDSYLAMVLEEDEEFDEIDGLVEDLFVTSE